MRVARTRARPRAPRTRRGLHRCSTRLAAERVAGRAARRHRCPLTFASPPTAVDHCAASSAA
eukprot:2464496-Prymnesium_polylepis.1